MNSHTLLAAGRLPELLRGSIDKVLATGGQVRMAARKLNSLPVQSDRQVIMDWHRLHDCFQLVEPVGPAAQDVQEQVHFAGTLKANLHRKNAPTVALALWL